MCMGQTQQAGPTAAMTTQTEIDQKMLDYYHQDFLPVLDKYIASRTDPNATKEEKNKVAGQVNADVMESVKPVSPSNPVANAKSLMDTADVKSDAETKGKQLAQARQIGTEENIIDIGKKKQTRAMSGMDELANMSVQNAIENKEQEEQVNASQENAMGSLIGTEAAVGMYGAKQKKLSPSDDISGWAQF